jgi:transposase-like protein
MAVVMMQLNDAQVHGDISPSECPHCGSNDFQRWGRGSREIRDIKKVKTTIYRYYCNYCHSTFRYYPSGIDRSKYTERVRRLAALIWLLDLSVRDIIDVFGELGVKLNRMAIWREGQKLVGELNSLKYLDPNKRLIIDKTGGLNNRPNRNVLLVLRLRDGRMGILGSLNTRDPNLVISRLSPILNELDVDIFIKGTSEL